MIRESISVESIRKRRSSLFVLYHVGRKDGQDVRENECEGEDVRDFWSTLVVSLDSNGSHSRTVGDTQMGPNNPSR